MIESKKIIYQSAQQNFEGFICWDNSREGPRPGVMVVHTFRGQSEFENEKATELAKLGYLAMAIDMYGQGRRASTVEEATTLMAELDSDRILLAQRIKLALSTLKQQKLVDPKRTAAIGFCFGGKCVLDLARSGADVTGVVSFHGIYDPPEATSSTITAKVLVLHGWDDPLALPDSLTSLGEELTTARADWQIHAFGHTGHAFTNRQARDRKSGMFYQANADRRAWLAMRNFMEEIFTD